MAVQINVQASQTALAQSISQGVAAYNARFASQNQLNLQVNPRSFSQPLGRITSDLADFESALKASNARVLAFGASTAVLGGSVKVFKEIANITIEIEKSLTDVNRVLGLSTSGLQKFSTELFSISKQTASSFDDATKAALEFSRQGLNTQETLKRTADALTLVRLTGISSRQAVEDLTSTINGFSKAGLTTSQVVNKLAAVEQDFAVSASDLTEALSRTGQAAQEAGVGFDELNALVTTAQQSTARGGAVIGNALKTIFTRLQRTDTLDQLENFNISVRDIEGNILPATQILKNFADQYKNLADSQRAQLSEQVAGVYQVNILKGIIGDLSNSQGTYTKALERGTMASNEADIANQKLNKTLSALSTQTGLGLQQLANNVGKVTFAPIFEAIVSPINDAVTYINETLEGEGPGSIFANGLLKGIRNVITGPGLAVAFAVIAKVAKNTFEDATKALPAILGITTEAQRRANIEKSILAILQTQSTLSLALQGQQGNATAQAATVLNYAKLQTAQYQQQLQIAQQLAPLLAAQNVTIGARGVQVGAKIKAGGHIPAFAEMSERMGAAMGGYKSGKVVKAPRSVGANTYMNTAEEAKYVPGFAQPFINPPAGSKAGRAHRQNSISRTGVDPYMNDGFIPNFANGKYFDFDQSNNSLNLKLNGLKIPKNKEFDPIVDTNRDSVSKLQYKIVLSSSKAALSKRFDNAMANPETAKEFLKYSSLKDEEQKNLFSLNYARYTVSKKDFEVSPFEKNKKEKILFSKQLSGVKSDTLGRYYEQFLLTKFGLKRNEKQTDTSNLDFIDAEAKAGDYSSANLLAKAIRNKAQTSFGKNAYYKNETPEDIDLDNKLLTLYTTTASKGFIPNFAPPTSAIRVPWFKKFGNASFDAVQPTLGISKANDTDTFRSSQFRSKAFEKAATDGDPNLFAPLYEDFVFKALQLTSQSKIKDQLIRGYVNQPGTNQKQSAYDAFLGDVALEDKGFPKQNLTGSISKNLNDKFERYAKANPAGAAKIKEAIMIFNEVGHENQIPSEFGKNFTQLAGTSYSQMLKNSPDLVKGLSTETNSLLNNYVKNPAFLAMNAAKGFIPNFAKSKNFAEYRNNAIQKIETKNKYGFIESSYPKNIKIGNKKLEGSVLASPLGPDLYSIGSAGVNIPDSGFGIPLYDAVLAEVSKKEAWLTSDRAIVSEKARKIWDGYRKLRTGDVKNKKLPMKYWIADTAFTGGDNNLSGNVVNAMLKNKVNWPPENDPVWSLQHAYQFKKSQLNDKMSSGFIPNFANNIDATSSSMRKALGLMPFLVDLKRKTYAEADMFHYQIANSKFIDPETGKSVYGSLSDKDMHGSTYQDTFVRGFYNASLGKADFELTKAQKEDKNFMPKHSALLEKVKARYAERFKSAIPVKPKRVSPLAAFRNEGFIPNFASRSEMIRDLIKFNLESTPDEKDKNVLGGKTTLFRGVRNNKNPIFGQSRKHSQTENSHDYFRDTDINKIANDHIKEKKLLPFVSASTDEDVAKYFARGRRDDDLLGSGEVGSKTIKNSRIFSAKSMKKFIDKYGEKALKQLMLEHSNWGSFGFGNGVGMNFQSFSQKKGFEGTDFAKEVSLFSKGFIPNFAYQQAVMGLEESMSGNKAVLDTKSGPFPFVRNTSQSNFASAISDHGGLKNALSDSMRNQEAAGLMNKGFVPNFATINAQTAIGASFESLIDQERTEFVELNKALSQLARNTKLTTQQQQQYINTVMNNAASLAASTKSTTIVSEASKALAISLQQNQNAQKKAAAQTQAQTQTNAQNTNSTGNRFTKTFEKLSNSVAFTLGVPMLAGQVESAIQGNRDRSQMTYGERFASTGVSAGLTGATTGAMIGSAILPGLGSAIGAGVGAVAGLASAAISAQTSLDDLSKSIEDIVTKNKNDIESAKTVAELEKKLSTERDPLNIEILKIKIAEAAEGIKNKDFAEAILKSSKSVVDFDNAIKKFTIKQRGLESLSRIPALIQSFSKETKTKESPFDVTGMFRETYDDVMLSAKDLEKRVYKISIASADAFRPMANEMIRLEQAVSEKDPALKPIVDDIIKNFSKYTKSGVLSDKLQPLVDAEAIGQNYADQLVKITETGRFTGNKYFENYLNSLEFFVNAAKQSVKEEADQSKIRVQDEGNVKTLFNSLNINIQNALNDYAIQLSNIDFAANIGKLNLEKTGSIFETAASAIGKNLQEIAKNQLDFLVSQMDTLRQNNLLDIQATQFKQSRGMQQETFLKERQSRISAFLEPNVVNAPKSRDLAEKALAEMGENLNYDFEKLKKLSLNFSEEIQRNLENLIEKEKREQKTFSNERRNAETLFNLDQEYAKKSIELKDKTAELDFKLQKTIYANLLKEKQVIESFNFANQDLQIRSQAQIERMSIPMNANPNFFAGATRFEQEDYKFKLDQEKERKQLAVSLRSASNESLLANFRNKIIDSNTLATNENTKAIRDLTIEMLEARLKNLPKAKPTQQISASQSISSVNEDYNTPYVLQDKYFAKPDKNQYKNEIISTIFDDLDSPAIKEYSDKANANAIKMYKRQSYMPNAENPVQFSYDSNLSRDLYGEKKPEAQIEQERIEPLSFFRQLYNVNTGNEKANQLPVEQRPYSQVAAEYQKKREEASLLKLYELQIPDSEPYKGLTYTPTKTTKNFVESIPETSVEAPSTQIETSQQRQAAETAETNVQLQSQIDLLKGVGRQNAIIKSDVADVSPYTSVIKSLEEEKVLFAKNLDLLEQRKQSLTEQKSIADADKNAEKSVQLNNQLLDVQGQINTGQLQRLKVEQSIESSQKAQKAYMDYMASRGKFMTGVKKATGQMREEIDMFGETLGGTITTSFRDGLVGAMNAAANETDNLESALMNVASNFLKAIQNAMFTQAANQITTSLFPTGSAPSVSGDQKGGFIRAQNGMYISGGRTGDKNPAMLEDGEYVLNRNAVRGMGGPSAVDKLNFETYPRFGGKQKGGKITGFAVGGDPGSMSASVNLARPFADLSGFGREQSPEFQAYVDEAREAQAKKDKKKAERKALLNQFLTTLITTGITMGISAGAEYLKQSSMATANLKGATGALSDGTTTAVSSFSDAKSLINSGGSVTLGNGSILNKSNFGSTAFTKSSFNEMAASRFAQSGINVTPGGFLGRKPNYSFDQVGNMGPNYGLGRTTKSFSSPSQAMTGMNNISSGYARVSSGYGSGSFSSGFGGFNKNPFYDPFKPSPLRRKQSGGLMKLNSGGFLPYGSRLTDSIPAYLSGGEYVVNSRAVRKYGVGGLNRINSGVARFAEGGMVGSDQTKANNTSNSTDNNVSISITINANGNGDNKEEKDKTGVGTEGPNNELANRIKGVVLEVISNEQRTGGLLDSTKKR